MIYYLIHPIEAKFDPEKSSSSHYNFVLVEMKIEINSIFLLRIYSAKKKTPYLLRGQSDFFKLRNSE